MIVPALLVHGGAGVLEAGRVERCVRSCEVAARHGYAVIERGGGALDAVEAAVRVLEDDGEFNAGHGAVLNRDGVVEVDAALMDGALRAGAVGAVPWMRHPVTLARRVLEEGRHVLLVGQGALEFARERGLHPDPPAEMITARSRSRWERERRAELQPSATGDTVGAVAIDAAGLLAAASSTGGISFKHPGRVGDSPIVGAGLYALAGAGAATATGHGESILRVAMSKVAVDALARGEEAEAAARRAIGELARLDHLPVGSRGTAGLILVDAQGHLGHHKSSDTMPWAAVRGGVPTSGA